MPTPTLELGKIDPQLTYEYREAVRCFIINKETNKICIIHMQKGNYYKLPGGGVEPEDADDETSCRLEDHKTSCRREALEETGCEVEVSGERIASTIEFRGCLMQSSWAYVCTVVKDTGKLGLRDLEVSEGLVHGWYEMEEALQKMKGIKPTTELGEFIQKRDVFLLETYLKSL